MKIKKVLIFTLLSMLCFSYISAAVSVGMTVGDEGLKNFYFSIGEFYKIPEKEVIIVRERGIPDEELPIVFFLAKRANVSYWQIIKWRVHNRWTWMKIAAKLRLGPEVFYVPVDAPVSGGIYERIYGYYQQPKHKWVKIKLTDEEVMHCVNLHFISNYYGYKPIEVIKMRHAGRNFIVINNDIRINKTKEMKVKYRMQGKRGKF